MAFGYVSWSEPLENNNVTCKQITEKQIHIVNMKNKSSLSKLPLNIGFRYNAVVSLENLCNAKTILDILPAEATTNIESIQSVRISILNANADVIESIGNGNLSNDQLNLLQSLDYSTNIRIFSKCKWKNPHTGILENHDLVYYMSIIPENEALYPKGASAIIDYIRNNYFNFMLDLNLNKLRPGRIKFTISEKGDLINPKLESSSGNAQFDQSILNLIKNLPEKWIPATNNAGKSVNQDLILFFGNMGC